MLYDGDDNSGNMLCDHVYCLNLCVPAVYLDLFIHGRMYDKWLNNDDGYHWCMMVMMTAATWLRSFSFSESEFQLSPDLFIHGYMYDKCLQ